jgi:hypothetical protein
VPIKDPVKEWVQENWWTWVEEKPGWFTDAWIAKVPDDFIPAEEDRAALQKLRKRSVFGGSSTGDEKSRKLSLGGGGTAAIVPVVGSEDTGATGSGANFVGVLKAPVEGGAGADEIGAAVKKNREVVGVKIDDSAVDGIGGKHRALDEKKTTTKVSEKRAGEEIVN